MEFIPKYCLDCGYDLRRLENNRCPECGRFFDPENPATFGRRPTRKLLRRLKHVVLWLAGAATLLGGVFAYVYWGWHQEEESLRVLRPTMVVRAPILPKSVLEHLGPFGFAFYRVEEMRGLGGRAGASERLGSLKWVRKLYLQDANIGDLVPIAPLRRLEVLDLANTGVRDLSPIAGLHHLRRLSLEHAPVSSVAPLSSLSELEVLDLSGTGVSDVSPLRGLHKLQELDLVDVPVRNIQSLATIPDLRQVDLSGSRVTDLRPLGGLVNIWELGLERTEVTDLSAVARMPRLERLYLEDSKVSNLAPLEHLSHLEFLRLDGTPVVDVSSLAMLSHLKTLTILHTKVNDILVLSACRSLRELFVSRGAFGSEQMEAFRKALPTCTITVK